MTSYTMDFGALADLLDRSGAPLQLAELHGGLCGVLCASGRDAAVHWLETLLDDCTADSELVAQLDSQLATLANETWQALNGISLEFAPLLPDDDSTIEQRIEALALWCHGFLAGLVVGGVDLEQGPEGGAEELSELVRDFAEISKAGVDSEALEDPELADGALFELVEYVRVGAQFVFEELVARQAPTERRKLH